MNIYLRYSEGMEQAWNNNGFAKIGDEMTCKSQSIADDIRRKIESGIYSGKLPTVRDFAAAYKVNFKTISKALDALRKEGILNLTRGRGGSVSSKKEKKASKIVALFIKAQGHVYEGFYNLLIKRLRENHYFPLYISDDSRQSSRQEIDRMLEIQPCAVVIERDQNQFDFEYLKEKENDLNHIVFVISNESGIEFNADYVLSDTCYGAYIATKHLLEKGHRKIMFISHAFDYISKEILAHSGGNDFILGYEMAMKEFGLEDNSVVFFEGGARDKEEAEFTRIMTANGRPTAFFANADFRVSTKIPLLKKLGFKIPGDVELMGYYNTPWSQSPEFPFSSVSIREPEIAKSVADRILSGKNQNTRNVIKPELIIRNSTAWEK